MELLAKSAVQVSLDGAGQFGVVTCAVMVRYGKVRERYAMSCQHVFSPTLKRGATDIEHGASVFPVVSSNPVLNVREVGRTVAYGGEVRADGYPSFDVQLAEVNDSEWLRRSLAHFSLSNRRPFVESRAELESLDSLLEILVPENHPNFIATGRTSLPAEYRSCTQQMVEITYEFGGARIPVYHALLLELEVIAPSGTQSGDSGSAVVRRNFDGTCTLVGMHIGINAGLSYAIPAWQLFEPVNYWKLPFGARLEPVNP